MKTAVIGAGAIGGFYGAALANAGMDVSFIARGKTLNAIRKHGLRLVGNTELTLNVPVTDDPTKIGQVDVVLLCTKTFQVAEAARTYLPALMGPHTLVVTTQNGVIAPRELSAIIGPEHVAPGVCRQWVKIIEPGLIMDLGGPRMFEISTVDDSPNKIINELREACCRGGLVSPDVADITTTLWMKMCSVVPQGACGAVLDVSLGDLLSTYRDVFARCIDETAQVARAHSARLTDDFVEKNLTPLPGRIPRRQPPSSATSLLDAPANTPPRWEPSLGWVTRSASIPRSMTSLLLFWDDEKLRIAPKTAHKARFWRIPPVNLWGSHNDHRGYFVGSLSRVRPFKGAQWGCACNCCSGPRGPETRIPVGLDVRRHFL